MFGPAGKSKESAERVAVELVSFGARVLIVENGGLRRPDEPGRPDPLDDEHLSPLVDILPVLLFTDALAASRVPETGFRHIGKVVTTI